MSTEEKTAMVQQLITDVTVTPDLIASYLALAADKIMKRIWPFGGEPPDFPSQYDLVQVQLAVRLIARKGGEGEIAHSENGISRTYDSVDDEDILRQLTPYVGVASL